MAGRHRGAAGRSRTRHEPQLSGNRQSARTGALLMGFIRKTPGGTHRASWRDPAGRQRSKTFKTKREANAFLSEVQTALHRGTYVDPDAGRLRFVDFATRWLDSREVEAR